MESLLVPIANQFTKFSASYIVYLKLDLTIIINIINILGKGEAMHFLVRVSCVLFLAISLSACVANTRHKVHYTLVEEKKAAPKKIVLLPVDIRVKEMSAGGVVEEVEEWSKQGKQSVDSSIRELSRSTNKFELVDLPEMSEEEKKTLEEYVALYDVVAGNALMVTNFGGEAWQHKKKHFDYTLGEGLEFLRDRTGADSALILIGEDVVSSSGRKAAFILAAAVGVSIPLGHSLMYAGIVDLKTGDVLWFDYTISVDGKDLRVAEDSKKLLEELLKNYPGIEEYRKNVAGLGN